MAPKRPHKTLTLAEKHEILQQLSSGVSGKVLADKYGVGTSTISDIKKKSEKIKRYVYMFMCMKFVNVPVICSYIGNCFSAPGRKQTLRKGEYPRMETELYSWFLVQRERHATVTSHILREKAIQLYAKHYGDNKFSASRGWVNKFKKRHGIRHLKVSGEKLSSDPNVVRPFLQKLSDKIKELNVMPNQIYNADESALFWKLLPDRTLVHAREKTAPGRKISKERVTFLAGANGDGSHKLKMMVIGKSKNPRAFKNCTIPVEYHSTKNAWMTSALFVKWFRESFVKQVRIFQTSHNLNGKALLLIDNAPSHATETQLTSDDGKIVTMFLPPNCTPLIQPMDQNAIRLIKLHYRKSLLVHILSFEESDISNTLKNINLKDAVFLLASSWDKVTSESIQKCWRKIFFYPDDDESATIESDSDYDSNDLIPLSLLKERMNECASEDRREIAEISNMLRNVNIENNQLTESEISEWIVGDEEHLPLHSDESDSEEEVVRIEPKVKHDEAIRCFGTCIQWAEENGAELNALSILRMLRQRAMEAKHDSIKQTKLTDFFK